MLSEIRSRLGSTHRERYWRSLDEIAGTPEFESWLHREFPAQASTWNDPASRRTFLKLMGASLALAGIAGCGPTPAQKTIPYTQAPEDLIPGKPLFFATATTLGGIASGVLATSHMGRPTKIEGNPQHPASLGATDTFSQASILSLYDPDRSQNVLRGGVPSTWGDFSASLRSQLVAQRGARGAGMRLLTETVTSPTLAAQISETLAAFPEAKWHQYEPINRDNSRAGAMLAFGEDANVIYRFENAETIISLDADFLGAGPGHVRYAREFAKMRRVREAGTKMNRLYVIEPTPSVTGAAADHRLPLAPHTLESFAFHLAQELGIDVSSMGATLAPLADPQQRQWISALARDLRQHAGSSIVIPGIAQPAAVHAIAHLINEKLENNGKTVEFTAPLEAQPVTQLDSLTDLVGDMRAGKVDVLLVMGGNPIYTAPSDLRFQEALERVAYSVHLSAYADETSRLCHWHIPQVHELECWSDARTYDGSITIMQPLIMPLYGGKSAHELLALLRPANLAGENSYEIVRNSWRNRGLGTDFEHAWHKAVHDGIVQNSESPRKTLRTRAALNFQSNWTDSLNAPHSELSIVFAPDPVVWDGRFANNGWLQELPKPLTRLTWDNAALISPRNAERLQLRNGQVVELHAAGKTLRVPIWIMPGQADHCVTLTFGYGRTHAGRAGTGIGYDAYALRTSTALWMVADVELTPTQDMHVLATTQTHHSMEGRDLVQEIALGDFAKDFAAQESNETPPSLYPPVPNAGHAWGMVIDLNACTGCAACVLGCQSENNIPVVGKEEVARGREMHWLRIDRYYKGNLDNPDTVFEPLACVHCESAPCEVVCPVAATTHSSEGLNQMVYNRCVGTRYCSNNCPYKVRRFNFLEYNEPGALPLMLMKNPDVTVRERGVMEKCTYCVQRINSARINAEMEDRPLRDGEIVTACQSACPSEAIVFGDINDPNSRVSKLKSERHQFGVLSELGTRPRTTYLSRVRNPNPELDSIEGAPGA